MVFNGDSVVAVHDDKAVLLGVRDGLIAGFRNDYADTVDPDDPDDWEHVFTVLPTPLLIPVSGATLISRIPRGSERRPVQISALSLEALPDSPASTTADYAAEYEALGPTRRVPLVNVPREIANCGVADPETLALLCWILYAGHHKPT
jgi:hypothetical protein